MTVQPDIFTTGHPGQQRPPLAAVPTTTTRRKRQAKTAWVEEFVMVRRGALSLAPKPYLVHAYIVRRVHDTDGRASINPTEVAALVGVTPRAIRDWLRPAAPKRAEGALYPFLRLDEIVEVEVEGPDGVWTVEERWLLRETPWDENERHDQVPKWWLWVDPDTTADGSQWEPTGVSPVALWAGALCLAEAKRQDGVRASVADLAARYGVATGVLAARLAAAKAAGLITVTDTTGGRSRRARRSPNRRPLRKPGVPR